MKKKHRRLLIHILLFLVTIGTTALAGAEWMFGRSFLIPQAEMGLEQFIRGFDFAIPFLMFLTVHEFGHYIMAKIRMVKVTLPFYIPLWLGFITSIGTAGAFIRIKQRIDSKIDYFDIGVAGPLAGFVVTLITLIYGLTHLPPVDYIFSIHPEYAKYGYEYSKFVYSEDAEAVAIRLGDTLLFDWLTNRYVNPELMPHPNEITHYPLIFAGYLGMFFTALNLMPIGQLDGGHILFSLIGEKKFSIVSPIFFTLFVTYAGMGFFTYEEFVTVPDEAYFELVLKFLFYCYFIYLCFSKVTDEPQKNLIIALTVILFQLIISFLFPDIQGYSGFLAFGFLLGRVLGIHHPPVEKVESLGPVRVFLGWLSMFVFVICFSLQPLY